MGTGSTVTPGVASRIGRPSGRPPAVSQATRSRLRAWQRSWLVTQSAVSRHTHETW